MTLTTLLARHDAAVAEYLAALREVVGRGYVGWKKYEAAIPPGCGCHNYAANGGK